MPLCRTFEAAEAQFQKADSERQALVDENEQLLQLFGMEETERKAKEQEKASVEKLAAEKQAEYDVEVGLRWRNSFHLCSVLFKHVALCFTVEESVPRRRRG